MMDQKRGRRYEAGKSNVQRLGAETGRSDGFWSTKKNYPDAVASIANLLAGNTFVTFAPEDIAEGASHLRVTTSTGAKVLSPPAFFWDGGDQVAVAGTRLVY